MSGDFRYVRVMNAGFLYESAYQVFLGAESIGYVWSRLGFSYRGMEGWNRGIRLRDYHPTEWASAPELGQYRRLSYRTRNEAAQSLARQMAVPPE